MERYPIEAPEKVGVYMIENLDTGKRYIGSAANLRSRLKQHDQGIRHGNGVNTKMQSDIDQGFSRFKYCVLATFEDGVITSRQLCGIEETIMRNLGAKTEYNFDRLVGRGALPWDLPLYAHGNVARAKEWKKKR